MHLLESQHIAMPVVEFPASGWSAPPEVDEFGIAWNQMWITQTDGQLRVIDDRSSQPFEDDRHARAHIGRIEPRGVTLHRCLGDGARHCRRNVLEAAGCRYSGVWACICSTRPPSTLGRG